jgi:hypothetical protein
LNHALGVASRRKEGPKSSTGRQPEQATPPPEPSHADKIIRKRVANPNLRPRKAAIQLVAEFENRAAGTSSRRQGRFGPERDLAQNYHAASPKAVRQALRILESRFLGSVRRGVHGRLALRVPDMEESAELMAIYLSAIGSGRDGFWAPRNYCCRKWPTVLTPRRILRILAALTQTFDRANSHLPLAATLGR